MEKLLNWMTDRINYGIMESWNRWNQQTRLTQLTQLTQLGRVARYKQCIID